MGHFDKIEQLARELHGDEKRKYTGDPYVNHTVAVANIVKTYGGDEAMVYVLKTFLYTLLYTVRFSCIKINFGIFMYKVKKTMSDDIRKMIDKVKSFKQFINQNVERTLTLYHGTCDVNGMTTDNKVGWYGILY